MSDFVTWLQGEHDAIMRCEQEALTELNAGNKAAYYDKMHRKAELLAALADKVKPFVAKDPALQHVEHVLEGYSGNAAMALRLNSVFFMSALLYKDEHKVGEPDNLQALINSLQVGGNYD